MNFYKTGTDGVYATIEGGKTMLFNKYHMLSIVDGEEIKEGAGVIEEPKAITGLTKIYEVVKDFRVIDEKEGIKFLIHQGTYEIFAKMGDELIPVDKAAGKDKVLQEKKKLKNFLKGLKKVKENYMLGDRVLLYGPTGTGKTYNLIEFLKTSKIDNMIIPVTEGMEDIDFFNRIIPGATGVEYKEKGICEFLERAEKGEKVCIVLDELNRGSNSLMNLILKALDPVDGQNYYLTDVIQDKTYVIPQENLLWAATVNLGGKYTGTNSLDEALLDRFNIIKYKGYDTAVEKMIIKSIITDLDHVKKIQELVSEIREYHSNGEIRAPISTRTIKMWMEDYKNSGDLAQSFEKTVLYRIVTVDDYGNPNSEEIEIVQNRFKKIIT